MIRKGIYIEEETYKDMCFVWNNAFMEYHKMALHYYCSIVDKSLQRINRMEEWLNFVAFNIDGRKIGLSNPIYNVYAHTSSFCPDRC